MAATEAQGGDAEATAQVLAVCLRSSLTAAFERHVEAAATEAADASGGAACPSFLTTTQHGVP